MLCVRTVHARSALSAVEYYTRYLTEAPGEVPGRWVGAQADGLGLAGDVIADDLLAVLEGHDPGSGTRLGRAFLDRELANGTLSKAVAGFDATFSAPKSLSVLWALTQDERLLDAHDVAVSAALAHIERFGSTTRVRVAGGRRLHPESQGLTIATFRQTTSRADDPQIHTHCVVSSKVQTADGRWLALDARYLKKHQRVIGGLYQSVLRSELTHRFGIDWGPITNGQAEMSALPVDLLAVFSKRSDEIDAALAAKIADFAARQGRDPNQWELGALKREAAVDTRGHKSGNGVPELVTRWIREAAGIGWTAHGLIEALEAQRIDPTVRPPAPSMDEVVDLLSAVGSSWNRAQIVGALTNMARPDPSLTGEQWAARIEAWSDAVASRCVELDPDDTTAPKRGSDGRSLWHEPISPHITTEAILAEEEFIASWALAAQAAEPRPSTTVEVEHLDVLQADVAAAVAGRDRLVLVVGPAGAGKTTSLRAAIDDLDQAGRVVFGVAPSAKAARVLERETGVASDTLAKLLHEYQCADRPPLDRYRLPAGSTVIVDEAGMVGTASLATLTRLATEHDWQLALVGDPCQLQAVGRGGMFHELCATGRAHELARIHRFTEDWEAAASLQLRRGDPRALDAYFAHDRVLAGTLDEHAAFLAGRSRSLHADGLTCAINMSSNDHVDAVNAAIQTARAAACDLDTTRVVPIGGSELAHVGDVVVTRRNDRRLTTTAGEPVRNREQWTVVGVGDDGSITVSSNLGAGSVTLPAEYARQHVRLGYAATEHGIQGDTTTAGAELVSEGTTRRGLYVGVTRGREENLILVITESHDLDEARDVLERVLANDRTDLPAVAQRRALAGEALPPTRRRTPEPRCEVPEWFDELRTRIAEELADARARADADHHELDQLRRRRTAAEAERSAARRVLDLHRPAMDAARASLERASSRRRAADRDLRQASSWNRRAARRRLDEAGHALDEAHAREQDVDAITAPARTAYRNAARLIRELDDSIRTTRILQDWSGGPDHAQQLLDLASALDRWHSWAVGALTEPAYVVESTRTLAAASHLEYRPACRHLADRTITWAQHAGVDIAAAVAPEPARPAPSIGIELGR